MHSRLVLAALVAVNLVVMLYGAKWGFTITFALPLVVNALALISVFFFKSLTLVWIYLFFFGVALVMAALFGPADAISTLIALAFFLVAKFILALKSINTQPLAFPTRVIGRK